MRKLNRIFLPILMMLPLAEAFGKMKPVIPGKDGKPGVQGLSGASATQKTVYLDGSSLMANGIRLSSHMLNSSVVILVSR